VAAIGVYQLCATLFNAQKLLAVVPEAESEAQSLKRALALRACSPHTTNDVGLELLLHNS
jgi:hypothetical protein